MLLYQTLWKVNLMFVLLIMNGLKYDTGRTLDGAMDGGHGFYDGQQKATFKVCGFGKRTPKLVEAPTEIGQ